jgi:hypothetical protein
MLADTLDNGLGVLVDETKRPMERGEAAERRRGRSSASQNSED